MSLPIISLFSGAGGLDLGLEDAGGEVRACVEKDTDSAKTLIRNRRFFPRAEVIDRPLEEVGTDELLERAGLHVGEAALVVGGPPCQPFSKSGYWLQEKRKGAEDPRADLVDEYLRVVAEAMPAGFVFENVPSLAHPSHRGRLDRFLDAATALGYSVRTCRLQAVEHGVPQARLRLFVLGLAGAAAPSPVRVSHWWRAETQSERRRLHPPETAGDWIASFNDARFAEADEVPNGKWQRHLAEVPPGMNYKFHTAWAGHEDPSFVTETKYWSFLLKLHPNRPSWTLQASPGPWTGPFHWDGRRLRIPEVAALQTFPPTYRFEGLRRSQWRQIGNAVPPVLASRVAASLLTDIAGRKPHSRRRLRYRLSEAFPFDENRFGGRAHPTRGSQW